MKHPLSQWVSTSAEWPPWAAPVPAGQGANGQAGNMRGLGHQGLGALQSQVCASGQRESEDLSRPGPLPKRSYLAGGRRRNPGSRRIKQKQILRLTQILWPENSSARMLGGTFSK